MKFIFFKAVRTIFGIKEKYIIALLLHVLENYIGSFDKFLLFVELCDL